MKGGEKTGNELPLVIGEPGALMGKFHGGIFFQRSGKTRRTK